MSLYNNCPFCNKELKYKTGRLNGTEEFWCRSCKKYKCVFDYGKLKNDVLVINSLVLYRTEKYTKIFQNRHIDDNFLYLSIHDPYLIVFSFKPDKDLESIKNLLLFK